MVPGWQAELAGVTQLHDVFPSSPRQPSLSLATRGDPAFLAGSLGFHHFLWHLEQFAGSPDLNAFSPLWQVPQFLPAFMSAIFIFSCFFI